MYTVPLRENRAGANEIRKHEGVRFGSVHGIVHHCNHEAHRVKDRQGNDEVVEVVTHVLPHEYVYCESISKDSKDAEDRLGIFRISLK